VGNRLTPPPQRDYVVQLERPNGRMKRAWRELRTGEPEAPRGASPQPVSDPQQDKSAEAPPRDPDAAATEPLPDVAATEPLSEPPAIGEDTAET
jgi:hypothetical protein